MVLIAGGVAFNLFAAPPVEVVSTPPTALLVPVAQQKPVQRLIASVGWLLERAHYSRQRLNDEISQKLLTAYIDALDYSHMIFYQSDVDEFKAKYQDQLDDLIQQGEIQPALLIFDRYMLRLVERDQLVQKLLKEKYDFTVDENYAVDRSKEPWPKDNLDAEKMWRARMKFEILQGRLNKEKPEETLRLIAKRYGQKLKESREFGFEDVLDVYLKSLTRCYDPHSEYFSRDDMEDFKINSIEMKLSGIGAVLKSEDGYAKIVSLVPGGPADLDKRLKPNDRIVGVAQGNGEVVDVVDMRLKKVVKQIRGKPGTEVRLTVIPANAADPSIRQVINITRNEVELKDSKAKGRVVDLPDAQGVKHRIGIVFLPSFYENCSEDVEKFLKRFQTEKVEGVILDMRRNGGGLLTEAIRLTGLFIESGPVVQVRNSTGSISKYRDEESKISYGGPLVVLVGHFSASASEIVAGALQDYGRAVVVGDSNTHGKGTVQALEPLARIQGSWDDFDPGHLKLTISKFYRVAGGSTQQKGVTPDIHVPSLLDASEIGESHLPNCLPYDEVAPAKFQKFPLMATAVETLRKRSSDRMTGSGEFKSLMEEIQMLRQRLAEKSVSLQEAKRQKEKKEIVDRSDARTKARRQNTSKAEKIFDVTLDDLTKTATLEEISKSHVPKAPKKEKANDEGEEEEDPEAPNDLQLAEAIQVLLDWAGMVNRTPGTPAKP